MVCIFVVVVSNVRSLILPIAYRERLYHRIMLATFICFLPLSLAIFIGTWVSIASNNRWFIYSLCFRCAKILTLLYTSEKYHRPCHQKVCHGQLESQALR